jgi:hypothetical protein
VQFSALRAEKLHTLSKSHAAIRSEPVKGQAHAASNADNRVARVSKR